MMIVRLINFLLLAGILVGIWRVAHATVEERALRSEFDSLSAAIGYLNIEDESRIYVRALENRPGYLAWRVFVPAGVKLGHRYQLGSSFGRAGGRMNTEPREVVFRWGFRSHENGHIEKTLLADSAHGSSSNGNRPVLELILDNWNKLDVEITGLEETVSFARSDVVSLLEIRIPESLETPTDVASIVPDEMFLRVGDSTTEDWQEMVFEIEERRAQRFERYSSGHEQ